MQFTVKTVSLLTNLDHNSPHVSSVYITLQKHIPNKYLTSDILYSSLLFYYSTLNATKNYTIFKLWDDLDIF